MPAHRRTDRLLSQALATARGIHDGLWLGVADGHLLDRMDEDFYAREHQYRDPAHNRSGLLDWESAALAQWFAGRRRLAVTATGGGREVVALLGQGGDPTGFECNPVLRAAANALLAEEGHTARVHPMARHRWPAQPTGPFEGVIVGWGSYMLMPGSDRRVEFLRGARAAVTAGSPVLVSFYTRPASDAYFRVVSTLAGGLRRVRRRPPTEWGDALTPNFVHFFTEDEIRRELVAGGFEPVWFAAEPYGHAVGLARA